MGLIAYCAGCGNAAHLQVKSWITIKVFICECNEYPVVFLTDSELDASKDKDCYVVLNDGEEFRLIFAIDCKISGSH